MARSPSREIQSRSRRSGVGSFSPSSSASAQPLGRVEAALDPLGQVDLLLGVEQRDLADLLEVGPDGVGRGGQLGVAPGLLERLGLLVVPLEVGAVGLGVGLGRLDQGDRLVDGARPRARGDELLVELDLLELVRPRRPRPWPASSTGLLALAVVGGLPAAGCLLRGGSWRRLLGGLGGRAGASAVSARARRPLSRACRSPWRAAGLASRPRPSASSSAAGSRGLGGRASSLGGRAGAGGIGRLGAASTGVDLGGGRPGAPRVGRPPRGHDLARSWCRCEPVARR